MIVDDKVVLVCDGCDQQFIVAVSMESGEEIWKTSRPPIQAPSVEMKKAYSTPTLITVKGKQQMVVPGAKWLCAYDPTDGKEIWRFDHGSGFSITPMASFEKDLVIFSTGYGAKEFVAVRPTGTGDVTKTEQAWRARNAPEMASMISKDGQLFAIGDKGVAICLNAETGEVLGKERRLANVSASPLLACLLYTF